MVRRTTQCLGNSFQTKLQFALRRPSIAKTEVGIRHLEPVSGADIRAMLHKAFVERVGSTRRRLAHTREAYDAACGSHPFEPVFTGHPVFDYSPAMAHLLQRCVEEGAAMHEDIFSNPLMEDTTADADLVLRGKEKLLKFR